VKTKRSGDITYEVIRSRRATADIVIERDGRVLVRAPKSLPEEQVEDLVEAKRYWIFKNLAEWRDLNATHVLREYRNGEGFLYLGRSYRLLLVAEQAEPLLLKNGRFYLRRDLVDKGAIETAKAAFRDYYITRGKDRITQRVNYYAPKVGVIPLAINVRELGNRWASCSPNGNLAFHWKCMMAPQTIIDYIVVHELCHFHHPDHTDAFWNEVDKIIPAYRERKEWLRKNGAGFDV
jgi:predicted metal-dependent hydrolase